MKAIKLTNRLEAHRWQYASNYRGEDYSKYIVAYTQTRDSDTLEQSNFEAMKQLLGKHCQVESASHWACGWVEYILVKDTAVKTLKKLDEALQRLEEYPILDEDHYNEVTCESTDEQCKDYASSGAEALYLLLSGQIDRFNNGVRAELPEFDNALLDIGQEVIRKAIEYNSVDDWSSESGAIELLTNDWAIKELEELYPNNAWVEIVREFYNNTKGE